MDRWAGTDGEYDRWADTDRQYDRWADTDRQYDRWADTDRPRDRWAGTERQYDRWAEGHQYDHLTEADGEYDRHDRPTDYARRPMGKWVGLFIGWVIVSGLLLAFHLTILIWVIMVGLIVYVVYGVLRETPRAARLRRRQDTKAETPDGGRERFNPPPGWPEPPRGWTPPPGWQPNPAWPPAPPGWQFWLPSARQGFGERTVRARHHRIEPDHDRFTDGWR